MSFNDTNNAGWNDPPVFSYDKATAIQAAATNKKKTSLNKRVSFPINRKIDDEQVQKSQPINDLKNPPVVHASHVPCSIPLMQPEHLSEKLSNEKMVERVKLDDILKNLQIDSICDDEIIKRIRLMEKMWKDNKLDDFVCLKIFELSQALANNDAETADHIQKSLMVDKISQCSSWMSGIRYLINQKRLKNSSD